MPKFEISIEAPPYTSFSNKGVNIDIFANYLFGAKVVGELSLNATVIGIGNFDAIRGKPIFRNGPLENGFYKMNLDPGKSLESSSQEESGDML